MQRLLVLRDLFVGLSHGLALMGEGAPLPARLRYFVSLADLRWLKAPKMLDLQK